jgi:DNA-directed RNA polymerase subunit M/transcription elongation factor TFIIS
METLGNQNKPTNLVNYNCKNCHYKTSKKSNYISHLSTTKHQNSLKGIDLAINGNQNKPNSSSLTFNCEKCLKIFKNRSGLWKHNKKCILTNIFCKETDSNIINNNDDITNIVLEVVKNNSDVQKQYIELQKQNQEFQQKMLESFQELYKNNSITNNITHTNSHNKSFNLNFFLNETCKNAMNITEFVDSIKLQLSDLENVGKIGYVEGLSKIIIKNLNALDVTERPVHCSDSKRDTMYVKDDDKWEKENEKNEKVLKAIEDIANKNSKQVKEWKNNNPECASSKSHKADVYSHIMIQAVCSNNHANNNKILKKIAKEVTIDKK